MADGILGIHHVTAIAGIAKRNFEFYTKVLGLRLVKKTVNFDDPGAYHLYYGNERGEPGTILTFFPWEGVGKGRAGTGQATATAFSISANSVEFWLKRFRECNVTYNNPSRRFNEEVITLLDPDGLKLELAAHSSDDEREVWKSEDIPQEHAIKGFYNVTLTLEGYEKTAELITALFGYEQTEQAVNRFRFITKNNNTANVIDLICLPSGPRGRVAGGSVHHIAFRVANEEEQLGFRKKLTELGYNVTPQLDRQYFRSIYFREPGGVLFEIATDAPGFMVDEGIDNLGEELKLPEWLETSRTDIEQSLPPL